MVILMAGKVATIGMSLHWPCIRLDAI